MSIELKKINEEIVKLYSDKKNNSLKIIRAFNPIIEHLSDLFSFNEIQKIRLKVSGIINVTNLINNQNILQNNVVSVAQNFLVKEAIEQDKSKKDLQDISDDENTENFVEIFDKEQKREYPEKSKILKEQLSEYVRKKYNNIKTEQEESIFYRLVEYIKTYIQQISFVKNADFIIDIVQDTMAIFLQRLKDKKINPDMDILALCRTIARNRMLNYIKKHSVQEKREQPIVPNMPIPTTQPKDVSEISISDEELMKTYANEIANMLKNFSPLMLAVLYEGINKSHQEIVDTINKNENHKYDLILKDNKKIDHTYVAVVLNRARIKLKSVLSKIFDRIISEKGHVAMNKNLQKISNVVLKNLKEAENGTWEKFEDKNLQQNRKDHKLEKTVYLTLEAMLNDYRKDKITEIISEKYLDENRTGRGQETITEKRLEKEKAKTGTAFRNEEAWGENVRPIDKAAIDRNELTKKETFNLKLYEQKMKHSEPEKRILDKDPGSQLDLPKTTIIKNIPDGFGPFLSKAFNLKMHKNARSLSFIKKAIQEDFVNIINIDKEIIGIISKNASLTQEDKNKIIDLKNKKRRLIGVKDKQINIAGIKYYLEKNASFDPSGIDTITQKVLEKIENGTGKPIIDEFLKSNPDIISTMVQMFMTVLNNPEYLKKSVPKSKEVSEAIPETRTGTYD